MNPRLRNTNADIAYEMAKRILVVEDEVDINQLINQHLSNSGFEVESVYDGYQALEAVEGSRFDLVVLDIMLPGIDGWEVCQFLRQSNTAINTPIVFLSALTGEVERIKGFDLGGDDYLVKPFSSAPRMAARRKPCSASATSTSTF
jgi:DNA-binding response OmpR family regulator